MSGIRRSANRPKIAAHLRQAKEKTFTNRTKEDRDRDHANSDVWAERERAKEPERVEAAKATRLAQAQGAERARRAKAHEDKAKTHGGKALKA